MAAGIQPTKQDIDFAVGSMCLSIEKAFDNVVNLKEYTDTVGSAGLEALGFSAGDAAVVISAITRLNALRDIYTGEVAQGATPEDFRVFPRQLWGLGY